eukprot:gene17724-23316_t
MKSNKLSFPWRDLATTNTPCNSIPEKMACKENIPVDININNTVSSDLKVNYLNLAKSRVNRESNSSNSLLQSRRPALCGHRLSMSSGSLRLVKYNKPSNEMIKSTNMNNQIPRSNSLKPPLFPTSNSNNKGLKRAQTDPVLPRGKRSLSEFDLNNSFVEDTPIRQTNKTSRVKGLTNITSNIFDSYS